MINSKANDQIMPKETKAHLGSDFKWLWTFVLPHKSRVVGLLVISLFASTLVLTQPYLTKQVIDEGLLGKNFDALLFFALILLTLGILSTLISGVSRYFHTKLSGQILFDLRERVYNHLQTLSPSFYARHRTGDILSRLDGDVAEIQRFALDGLFSFVSAVIGLVGALSLIFWLNAQLAMIAFIMLPLEWLWLRYMRPKVEQKTRQLRECSADISSFLVETLPAMKFIQTVSAEKRENKRLQHFNGSYLNTLLGLQVTEFTTQAIPTFLTTLSRTIVFLIGGYWVIQDQMALGSLIAFSTYLGMAVGPVHTLLGLYVAVKRVKVSLNRVRELTLSEVDVDLSTSTQPIPSNLMGNIEFKNLTFSYPESNQIVFDNANAFIPAGAKVGIYGPSGIGKSTLIDLVLRHFDPINGQILIDDCELKQFNLSLWRKKIAVVSQDIVLFRGTLADNIRYANPKATDEAVLKATEQAQLSALINQLPDGLDTRIGERGARLSGGQKQRVALARALLQDPLILILDEATSGVDSEQEHKVMEVIDCLFKQRTRLIISHRENPIKNADWLLTIAEHKLWLTKASKVTNE